MKFYTKTHQHYCGIDLHTKNLYVCILNQEGDVQIHKNIRANPKALMTLIKPFLDGLVIGVECMFSWYWVADFCEDNQIVFVLGHALYMKAIHGGKAKNDRIDSPKIATLLHGGMFPEAYVYPRTMRATRDLMRRRMHMMRFRAELLAHIQNTNSQYNLPEIGKTCAMPSIAKVSQPALNIPAPRKALNWTSTSSACSINSSARWNGISKSTPPHAIIKA